MLRLLIVDNEPSEVEMVEAIFKSKGFEVRSAQTPEQALAEVAAHKPDVAFLDMDLLGDGKDRSGRDLLVKLRQTWDAHQLLIIVISGVGNTQLLTEVEKLGADDYEMKPVDYDQLHMKILRLLQRTHSNHPAAPPWKEQIIGKSRVIMELHKKIIRCAHDEMDLTIYGDTGTGKERVAEFYYQNSPRSQKNFQVIDCTKIPTNLFESEVFGYEKNAFTGAQQAKAGLIESAHGGILFFDEIGEIPLEQQPKFLRFLETRVYTPLGATKAKELNAIILSATNRNLEAMVEAGTFRNDLLQRFNKNRIKLPLLRERLEDLEILVEHFIQKCNYIMRKNICRVEPRIYQEFRNMSWPGNIRELENVIEYGGHNSLDDTLLWEDVRSFFEKTSDSGQGRNASRMVDDIDRPLQEFEKVIKLTVKKMYEEYLNHHIGKHHHNITQTAEALGVSREYLNALRKRYDLQMKK